MVSDSLVFATVQHACDDIETKGVSRRLALPAMLRAKTRRDLSIKFYAMGIALAVSPEEFLGKYDTTSPKRIRTTIPLETRIAVFSAICNDQSFWDELSKPNTVVNSIHNFREQLEAVNKKLNLTNS